MKKKLIFLLVFIILAFILNFIWEYLHLPLYKQHVPWFGSLFLMLLYSSLVDAVIILAVYFFVSSVNKKMKWKISWKNILLYSGLLIIMAVIIEVRALSTGGWAYKEIMPTIFGVGISPLLQLTATGL